MGAPRPPAGGLDQTVDVVGLPFEHCFDTSVVAVSNPARDSVPKRRAPERVPEVDPLDVTVGYDMAPLHGQVLARLAWLWVSSDSATAFVRSTIAK